MAEAEGAEPEHGDRDLKVVEFQNGLDDGVMKVPPLLLPNLAREAFDNGGHVVPPLADLAANSADCRGTDAAGMARPA